MACRSVLTCFSASPNQRHALAQQATLSWTLSCRQPLHARLALALVAAVVFAPTAADALLRLVVPPRPSSLGVFAVLASAVRTANGLPPLTCRVLELATDSRSPTR
jgi:O-succinylbenzoate synthase